MSEDPLSAVLDRAAFDGEPTDSNGNSLGRYRAHNYLSRYPQLLGIDSRGVVVFFDGENVQNALLDRDGSIVSLSENPLFGDSPAEHVVNVAAEYGRWKHVDPGVAERIVATFGDRLTSLSPTDDDAFRFTEHARERWGERVDEPLDEVALAERWVAIDVPGWDEEIRYDPETGAILVVDHPAVITVLPTLRSLDPDLRERVQTALVDEGVFH